jgi:L-malate glycosyltransferase
MGEKVNMARVRIAHMHSSFDMGGKEARCVQLMNHFGDEAEHSILVALSGATGAKDALDPGIKVEFPGDAAPSLMGMPGPKRYLALAHYMQQFDLILSYNWGAMDPVMARTMFSPFMKLPPLIHHEDGFNDDEADRLMPKRNWYRVLGLSGAYGLVVPSNILWQVAIAAWKQPESKIHQIANGIHVGNYRRSAIQDVFPGFIKREGEVIVGTVAGLRAVKNLPRLVRAVAAAGPNVKLAIAGTGPEKDRIEAEAERLGIGDRLMMGGFLKDPARYIGLFDIFALSSDSEQFPISMVEAMAAGLPVAATDVGDIKHIVSPENKPYIVNKADESGFATAIAKLAQNSELRRKLGDANLARATAEYDEQIMFNKYRNLYGNAMRSADFARQIKNDALAPDSR